MVSISDIIRVQNLSFAIHGDKVGVWPAHPLTDTLRWFVRGHKTRIIDELRGQDQADHAMSGNDIKNIQEWFKERAAILGWWLAHIEETDSAIIAEVLDKYRADLNARAYFLQRAGEVQLPADCADKPGHHSRYRWNNPPRA